MNYRNFEPEDVNCAYPTWEMTIKTFKERNKWFLFSFNKLVDTIALLRFRYRLKHPQLLEKSGGLNPRIPFYLHTAEERIIWKFKIFCNNLINQSAKNPGEAYVLPYNVVIDPRLARRPEVTELVSAGWRVRFEEFPKFADKPFNIEVCTNRSAGYEFNN